MAVGCLESFPRESLEIERNEQRSLIQLNGPDFEERKSLNCFNVVGEGHYWANNTDSGTVFWQFSAGGSDILL